jgi:hypothetical protein
VEPAKATCLLDVRCQQAGPSSHVCFQPHTLLICAGRATAGDLSLKPPVMQEAVWGAGGGGAPRSVGKKFCVRPCRGWS